MPVDYLLEYHVVQRLIRSALFSVLTGESSCVGDCSNTMFSLIFPRIISSVNLFFGRAVVSLKLASCEKVSSHVGIFAL